MNVWICVIIGILIATTAVLAVKVYLMKKSAREIRRSFEEKLTQDTNTLIHISSHDPDMRALAGGLNVQLQIFHEGRQKFEHGDLELKEAVTNISHDFRTPLTLVADPVDQLLASPDIKGHERKLIELIKKNTGILLRLVNQILDFRKYENGKMDYVAEPLDLRKCFSTWNGSFTTAIVKKHIHFTFDADPSCDFVTKADRTKMESIYFNLLSNAFKYTPENGNVTVKMTETGGANPHIKFTVSNTGSYIEPPLHANWGCHTHLGDHVYANFGLTLVDDCDIYIGSYTMLGPNVVLAAAGHPVRPDLRRKQAQYNLPIRIGENAWLGAGVIVLPGVTIGENSVIGAGSVVTKDIPANVVAVGNPCRVIREINDRDREYYYRDRKIDID